jgi:hypothetical protein
MAHSVPYSAISTECFPESKHQYSGANNQPSSSADVTNGLELYHRLRSVPAPADYVVTFTILHILSLHHFIYLLICFPLADQIFPKPSFLHKRLRVPGMEWLRKTLNTSVSLTGFAVYSWLMTLMSFDVLPFEIPLTCNTNIPSVTGRPIINAWSK